MEITNDEIITDVPDVLADLMIRHKGWREATDEDRERLNAHNTDDDDDAESTPETFDSDTEQSDHSENTDAESDSNPKSADELNPAAACDDDLPDGITFADSAYTTVVDPDTGEKIRVLKTHCRNDHEYTPENTKIRLRGSKAYRECQTCLKGRRERAKAKKSG